MSLALFDPVVPGSISWRREEWSPLPARIIKGHGFVVLLVGLDVAQKAGGLPIARIFGVSSVVIADAVGRIVIAIPAQIRLDGLFAGAMRFGFHNIFTARNTGLAAALGGNGEEEERSHQQSDGHDDAETQRQHRFLCMFVVVFERKKSA